MRGAYQNPQEQALVNYQEHAIPPLPTHDTKGLPLSDRIRNMLPVGTVEVRRPTLYWYIAVNNNNKTVMIPELDYIDGYVEGHVYTSDDIPPTHDWLGNQLSDEIIQLLPDDARDIIVGGQIIRSVSYRDINGDRKYIALH